MSQIDSDLIQHIVKRATDGNIGALVEHGLGIDDKPEFEYLAPEAMLYEIAGTFDGAVDFEVIVTGPYEVNIVDWIAEKYNEDTSDGESWEITLTPYLKDEDGTWFTSMSNGDMPLYRVSSYPIEG